MTFGSTAASARSPSPRRPRSARSLRRGPTRSTYGSSPRRAPAPLPPRPAPPTSGSTITGISPTSGTSAGGFPITINGYNFVDVRTVTVGGKQARFSATPTKLTVTAPPGTGTVPVTVTTGQGTTTTTQRVSYLTRPEVRGLSPSTGTKLGGTTVTLTGINFSRVTAVKFGTKRATSVNVLSPTKLTAKAPPAAGNRHPHGHRQWRHQRRNRDQPLHLCPRARGSRRCPPAVAPAHAPPRSRSEGRIHPEQHGHGQRRSGGRNLHQQLGHPSRGAQGDGRRGRTGVQRQDRQPALGGLEVTYLRPTLTSLSSRSGTQRAARRSP